MNQGVAPGFSITLFQLCLAKSEQPIQLVTEVQAAYLPHVGTGPKTACMETDWMERRQVDCKLFLDATTVNMRGVSYPNNSQK